MKWSKCPTCLKSSIVGRLGATGRAVFLEGGPIHGLATFDPSDDALRHLQQVMVWREHVCPRANVTPITKSKKKTKKKPVNKS